MGKGITFGEKDEELVRKIEEYQRKYDLDYFVEAVRKLCDTALSLEKTLSNMK